MAGILDLIRQEVNPPGVATVVAPEPPPEAPQPVLSTAMAPASVAPVASQIPPEPPYPPLSVGQGILSKIANRPDAQAIYDGLLKGGVGMLAAGDMRKGLAAGFGGFGEGYDARVAADRTKTVPKVTPLADGAFSQLVFPDGKIKIVPNSDVQKYIKEIEDAKTNAGLNRIAYQGVVTQTNQAAQNQNRVAAEARNTLNSVKSTIGLFEQGLQIANNQGWQDQVQAAPLIRGVAEFFGTEGAAGNKILQALKVDAALQEVARTKGAISEKEMALFLSPVPSDTADRQTVWKPWIENKLTTLRKLEKALQEEVTAGATAPSVPPPGRSGTAPAASAAPATPAAGTFTVPGLSPNASKYFSQ